MQPLTALFTFHLIQAEFRKFKVFHIALHFIMDLEKDYALI